MTQFTVYHSGPTDPDRTFRSWKAAEAWARKRVTIPNARGFFERAEIFDDVEGETVATVRMDGAGRVWTDIISERLPV